MTEIEEALQSLGDGLRTVGRAFEKPAKPKPRPPIIIVTNEDRVRLRKKTLTGWVVGWGGLYLDDDGWLGLREDARVFKYWIHAFWKSWLLPFFPLPFFGIPRRQIGQKS